MALSKQQKGKLTNAITAWSMKHNTNLGDLLALTPTERRDVLTPFVQADRDATIAIQAKLAAYRAEEDADLQQSVDDCNKVLLDLDSATIRVGG